MRLSNLLKETERVLANCDKASSDVDYCSLGEVRFSWAEFAVMANGEYNAKTKGQMVNPSLMICGKDWRLERELVNGVERWAYKKIQWVDTAPQLFDGDYKCIL